MKLLEGLGKATNANSTVCRVSCCPTALAQTQLGPLCQTPYIKALLYDMTGRDAVFNIHTSAFA